MTYIQEAFNQICKEAQQAEGFYCTLMEKAPYYGGPEEGGWWGEDHHIVAYQHFSTIEQAEMAKFRVEAFANELSLQSHRDFGDHCISTMDWLEARGLDADYLPEPDGESTFYVVVSEGLPEESFGPRHYE